MSRSNDYARRSLRELPKDPCRLLQSKKYAKPAFLPLFFEWLDELIYSNPRKGLRWAEIAPELVLVIPEDSFSEGRKGHRSRLIQAWALVGGANRLCGDHDAADKAYGKALKEIESEKITGLVKADTEYRLSTLRACQGRAKEALSLASGAVEALRKIDGAPLGPALVSQGYVLAAELGRYAEAINAFGEALTLTGSGSSAEEERTHAAAAKNLAMALSDAGSFADQRTALLYLGTAHRLLKGRVRCPERYRLYWVEALVWDRLGSHAKAERLFRKALEGFEVLQMPWDAALVGLDLAALLHLCGDLDALEKIACSTFKRFRVLSGADTQTLAAFSLWVDAVKRQSWAEIDKKDPGKPAREYDAKHSAARLAIMAGVARNQCCHTRRGRRRDSGT